MRWGKVVVTIGVIVIFLKIVKHMNGPQASEPQSSEDKVEDITRCSDKLQGFKVQQHGNFCVLSNYVTAEKTFGYNESITYTTQADYTFLDNVPEVVRRWLGPISVALYAPGDDFYSALRCVAYLRECTDLVKEYVTFHIFFDTKHLPKKISCYDEVFTEPYNCSMPPPLLDVSPNDTYRAKNKLFYPINVGRNIAREMAQTHYIFPSDIELYPNTNIIPRFLKMAEDPKTFSDKPRVFVLQVFEVEKDQNVPETKKQLVKMVNEKTAITFHKRVCPDCHRVPNTKEWLEAEETEGLKVFTVGKRTEDFSRWEPFYIGTNVEPFFDERLTWEGQSNKMVQAYAMCVLDYDFAVLDNAFLVHRPGIKKTEDNRPRWGHMRKTNALITDVILPEYNILYGTKEDCTILWGQKNPSVA